MGYRVAVRAGSCTGRPFSFLPQNRKPGCRIAGLDTNMAALSLWSEQSGYSPLCQPTLLSLEEKELDSGGRLGRFD